MNNNINFITTSSGCANYITSTTQIFDNFNINYYNEYITEFISLDNIINWFLFKESMTISKATLLLYYTESWYFSLKNKKLMNINFYANSSGILSYEIKQKYPKNDILSYNSLFSLDFNNEIKEFLESIWITYGNNTENSLRALIMSELPYIDAIKKSISNSSVLIDEFIIRQYYLSIYSGNTIGTKVKE